MSNCDMMDLFIAHLTADEAKKLLVNDFQGKVVYTYQDSSGYEMTFPYSLVTDDPDLQNDTEIASVTYSIDDIDRNIPGTNILLGTDWYFEAWTELFWNYFEKNTDYDFELVKDYAAPDKLETVRVRGNIPTFAPSYKTA